VEHRGQERIGHAVSRHVEECDAGHPLTTFEILGNLQLPFVDGALDASPEIEPLLEIDIDNVIAAHHTVKRERPAVHVDPRHPG
jgi:hypothetical protein